MLDFEMCDYSRMPAEDAQPILFDYLCFLDNTMDASDLRSVTGRIPGPETACAEFMAASDEKLFKLSHAFKETNRAARMTILWYLSCCDYRNAKAQFLNGFRTLQKSYRHSGQSLVRRYTQAIETWEEDLGAGDSPLLEDDDMMPSSGNLLPSEKMVCAEVGDPNSKDGREIARRYAQVVGNPLPLRGEMGDIALIHQDLVDKFPWARNVVGTICGQLALLARGGRDSGYVSLPPILVVGRPGSGKTRLLHDLCEALSLPFSLVPCGGTADSGGLLPVSRGWSSARASGPVQAMLEKKCANPAMLLDEIDKASVKSVNGSLCDALLSMMNGDQSYYDACLMNNVDFSAVSFLATANSTESLPEALRDRFMVIEMPVPKSEHFDCIFEGIMKSESRRLGIEVSDLPELDDIEIEELKSMLDYPEASIRMIERAYRSISGDRALSRYVETEPMAVELARQMR